MKLNIKKLHPKAITPRYATEGAACFDLHCTEYNEVFARGSALFHTGLSIEVPDGWAMLVFSRSGHGFKNNLRLSNCVGVIDSDYRGEIIVRLHNDGPIDFSFEAGDRIAQAMITPVLKCSFEEVSELTPTLRGYGGFGSTGK